MPAPPLGERVASLETTVEILLAEVRSMKRALWGVVATVLGGMLLFLFSLASGWIGPGSGGISALPF
jgi:hypothetical protein